MTWLLLYVVVAVVLLVPFQRLITRAFLEGSDADFDLGDGVFCWFLACMAAGLWPVIAVCLGAVFLSRFVWSWIGDRPRVKQ